MNFYVRAAFHSEYLFHIARIYFFAGAACEPSYQRAYDRTVWEYRIWVGS